MLAALFLDELQKKGEVTKADLAQLYKRTYTEAYKEGQRDQKTRCGCGEED